MSGMKFSINTARNHVTKKDLRSAITHYLIILAKIPEAERIKYKEEFLQTLVCYSLQNNSQVKQTFTNIITPIIGIFPSMDVYQSLAEILIQLDLRIEAWRLLSSWFNKNQVEPMNDDSAVVRIMKANLSTCIADSWHIPMLNNKERNRHYKEAIDRLPENKFVLEIGSGTGLLSVFVHSRNLDVVAVEQNDRLVQITSNTFVQNGTKNSKMMKVFHCLSTQMDIEKTVGQKADVLISEIFDNCAFGEDIIPVYLDAHRRLIKPNTIFIPSGFKVYATFVQSPKLRSFHVFDKFITEYVNVNHNFGQQPYWSDNLKKYPDLEFISEPLLLYDVDLANPNQLRQLMDLTTDTYLMNVTKAGTLHAIVVHFTASMGENLTLQSNMKDSCWDYGIFPLRKARSVELDEKIGINVTLSDGGTRLDIALIEELEEELMTDFVIMENKYMNLCYEEGFSKEVENDHLPTDNKILVFTPFNWNIPAFEDFEDVPMDFIMKSTDEYQARCLLRKSQGQLDLFSLFTSPFDHLVYWPFYPDGALLEGALDKFFAEIFKLRQYCEANNLEYMAPRVTPSFIECHAQLVYSNEMDIKSRIQPDSHFGVDVNSKDHPMGLFELRDIYLNCFEHKIMSEVFKPFRFDFQAMFTEEFYVNDDITLPRSFVKQVECTEDGEVDGILYWWQAKTFNSRNMPCCSFVFPERISVMKNDVLNIRCDYFKGHILMSLEKK